jgi:hypothetical protein
MPDSPDAYKPTFFDRHGPDAAAYVSASVWGVSIGSVFFVVLAGSGHALEGLVLGVPVALVVGGLGPAMGYVFGSTWRLIAVDGGSTPSVPQYSYEQSLIMQGKVAESLASFEIIIAAEPAAVRPRIVAADLYLREAKNAARSAELLHEAQLIRPLSPGDDIYIANRLVDLYVGPLGAPHKALRELRRIIDRYDGTDAASHARTALAELKARHVT